MVGSVVIVGAGQAAASCASKLRSLDADCKITMIGEEPHLPYQRPPLSKKYAVGEMTREQLLLKPETWYVENRIEFVSDRVVEKLDRANKTILLSDGTNVSYDQLVFATGSRPRTLPEAIGGNLEGVYTLRGIDDADKISNEMTSAKNILIVGGGYIGLEAAAVMTQKGIGVDLVEMAERILQRVACPQTADFFRDLHSTKGVKIHEGTGLEELLGENGRVKQARLSSGQIIDVDFVLVGIGIIANDDVAEEGGILVHNGILVNAFGQTNDPDIYAAGDCTAFKYQGNTIRLESVQNAIDQAECVAKNIIGEDREYLPVPWFWSDQYDVKLQIAGLNAGYDKVVVRAGQREGTQSVWYFKGKQFISVDAMNDPRAYMVGKKLLEAGKNVTKAQIKDETLELKSLL